MGFKRKLKRSYFSMFVIPSLIIVLIAACVLVIVSERYEQQLENISDEAILTAAAQSVIKDFKEVDDRREERSYNTMTVYLAESGYSLFITADGVEKYNTLTQEDLVIMDKYDDSLYESEDFMTIDNGTVSVIKQRFLKGETEYVLYAVNTDYNPDALVDKLFLFSKLDTNKYPFHFSSVCLSDYLASFADTFEGEYRKKGLALSVVNTCPEDTRVNLDMEEMNRVLTNLLDNSSKNKTGPTTRPLSSATPQ